jgi:hypothetical protein
MKKFASIVLVIAALGGCASTYKSPNLPQSGSSSIAVLEPKDFQIGAKFFITHIDGQSRGIGWFNRFELTPGRRSVTAAVNSYSFSGASITRYFTAEPGKTYQFVVYDDPRERRWSFSIVEKESGTRVDSTSP